jgi:2-hydroxychromene-2-carboxylate isomerase
VKKGPRLFFSFRSPFSWLLVERLLRLVPDAHERIELIPYWEPDEATERALAERGAAIHYVPMTKAKHLYILQDTKRIAERLGLSMAWPVDVEPWWEPSHLGWLRARRLGKAPEFYAAVTSARWERGENIGDPLVIRALGESVGLDGEAIAGAVDDPEVRAEGVECLVEAYEDDIFGVPYLRLGWHRFWGFDRLDEFLAAFAPELDRSAAAVAREARPVADPPLQLGELVGTYDTDTAGGCG